LVGNKLDLTEEREVGAEMVRSFAERHNLEALETSALTGKGVKEAFTRLAFEVSRRLQNHQVVPITSQQIFQEPIEVPSQNIPERNCC
jgi:GTPase SAR1 family protein